VNEYLSMAKDNIAKCRKKDLAIFVKKDGRPVENCHVSVSQKRHEFLFGANCFDAGLYGGAEKNGRFDALFADIFNYATLPYYWGSYEPEKGKTIEARLIYLNDWCDRLGLERKGHPLHWHEVPPKWLREDDFPNLENMIKKRVRDIVSVFKDRVKMWDIANEITRAKTFTDSGSSFNLISRYEVEKGEANVVDMLARLVLDIDPGAKLLLNECNLRKDDFSILLTELKDRKTPLYGIGLQSHMHEGTNSLEYIWKQNDRYSAFGLPLHYTELSILSGKAGGGVVDWYSPDGNKWIIDADSEEIQAREVEDMYTILFGHPAVEAITWWDIVDGNWLSAPSGLVSREMAPKPAYDRLKKLIKEEWRTNASGLTGSNGAYTASAFYGEYDIRAAVGSMAISRTYIHSKHGKEPSSVTIEL